MKLFTKKELAWVILAILIIGFIIGWGNDSIYAPYGFLISLMIILTSFFVKKIAAHHYSVDIEHKIWSLQRYGLLENSKFKKPFPIGVVFPFFISLFSNGMFKIFAILQFDEENMPKKRLFKKRGQKHYSEINESDLAFISAWGFWALIFLSAISIILKQPEIAKYSVYYGLWNLIPVSNLDGIKIFFGSLINWIILAFVYFIAFILIIL